MKKRSLKNERTYNIKTCIMIKIQLSLTCATRFSSFPLRTSHPPQILSFYRSMGSWMWACNWRQKALLSDSDFYSLKGLFRHCRLKSQSWSNRILILKAKQSCHFRHLRKQKDKDLQMIPKVCICFVACGSLPPLWAASLIMKQYWNWNSIVSNSVW